jgi:predicted ATPase
LGAFIRIQKLVEGAVTEAVQIGHIPTLAGIYQFKAYVAALCNDAAATLETAQTLIELSERYELAPFRAFGGIFSGWARAKLGDRETGVAELRQALTAYVGLGNKADLLYPQGLLAEIEADDQRIEAALTRIDEALALATFRRKIENIMLAV